jgi:hypothetical protein
MTHFDKFLMQGLSKYYKKIIMILKDFLRNILVIFLKSSHKAGKCGFVIPFAPS